MNVRLVKGDGKAWCAMSGDRLIAWVAAESECEAWQMIAERLLLSLSEIKQNVNDQCGDFVD